MSFRSTLALVAVALGVALPGVRVFAGGALPTPAPQAKDDKERRKEAEKGREPGAVPAEGGRVIGERSVRILDKEDWEALKKKGAAQPEGRSPAAAPSARVVSSEVKQATAFSLGRTVEVSEGDGYRITRREISPPLGGGELYKTARGYIVQAGGTVSAYDESGRQLGKRSFLTPPRPSDPLATRREIRTCGVNAQGWLALEDRPAESISVLDAKGKLIGRSDDRRKLLVVSPMGGLVYSAVMEGSAVEIAPDGKTLLEWRGAAGFTVHDIAARKQKRVNVQIVEGASPGQGRYVTDTGSVLCMRSTRAEGGYALLHISCTGKILYQKAGPWWLKDAAGNGNALLSPRGKPYRLVVLDPSGNQLFEKPCFQYGSGLFLNGGEHVVLKSLPGQREYYSTIFRVSDGKELCSIPTSHSYHSYQASAVGKERLYCYDTRERTLTLYSVETSRRLRVVRLRHRESHALNVASMEESEGALLLTFGGKAEHGAPLVDYKIELKDVPE